MARREEEVIQKRPRTFMSLGKEMTLLGIIMILAGLGSIIEEEYINPKRYERKGFAELKWLRVWGASCSILGGMVLVLFFPWSCN